MCEGADTDIGDPCGGDGPHLHTKECECERVRVGASVRVLRITRDGVGGFVREGARGEGESEDKGMGVRVRRKQTASYVAPTHHSASNEMYAPCTSTLAPNCHWLLFRPLPTDTPAQHTVLSTTLPLASVSTTPPTNFTAAASTLTSTPPSQLKSFLQMGLKGPGLDDDIKQETDERCEMAYAGTDVAHSVSSRVTFLYEKLFHILRQNIY